MMKPTDTSGSDVVGMLLDDAREPPGGGLARLVAHVDGARDASTPWPRRSALAAACVLIVLALSLTLSWRDRDGARARRLIAAAAVPVTPTVHVEHGAALELPSSRSDVRLVWIAALPPPTR